MTSIISSRAKTQTSYASGEVDPITSEDVDWGDGNSETVSGDPSSFSHYYCSPGSYTVTAIANTADGPVDSSSTTTTVTVAVPVPTLTFCSSSETVGEGESVVLYPDFCCCGADAESDYMLDWGDGTSYETSFGCTASEFDHSYAHGGTDYHVEAFLETSVGVVAAEADITVTGSNPINDPGGYDTGFSLSDATTGGALPATTGQTVHAFVSATMDEFCSTGEETESGGVDFGNCSGYGTFDFNNTDGTNPSSAVDYSYHEDGQYLITMVATDLSEETKFATVDNAVPVMNTVPEQVASSGQSFSVTENFSNVSSDLSPVAFVDWGDGTGPHPATITPSGGGAGTITASTSSAPAPGTYTASITLYPMGPTGTSGTGAPTYAITKTFTLYSWGVVIDHGESNDLLIASSDGTQNQQAVTLIIPHPAGEAFTVNLSGSDVSQNYLFNSSGTKLTPSGSDYPSVEIASGDSTSSITYEDGAIDGNSTAGVDQYTVNCEYDASDSTTTFQSQAAAGCGTVPAEAPTSKPASQAGVTIQLALNPNTGIVNSDVTDQSQNWLVGQYVDVKAIVTEPNDNMAFRWTMAGQALYRYQSSATEGAAVGLEDTNIVYPAVAGFTPPILERSVGLDQSELEFFWPTTASGTAGPESDVVTVTVNNVGEAPLTVQSTFAVYTPTASFTVTQGTPGIYANPYPAGPKYVAALLGLTYTPPTTAKAQAPQAAGIIWSGTITTPVSLAAGQWNFVQLYEDKSSEDLSNGTKTPLGSTRTPRGNEFALDRALPYGTASISDSFAPFSPGLQSWPTDVPAPIAAYDAPLIFLPHDPDVILRQFDMAFHTYVMYRPPGSRSQWVPLIVEDWEAQATAKWVGLAALGNLAGWVQNAWGNVKNIPGFVVATEEPTWTALA